MKYWSSHFSVHRHKVCHIPRTRVRGRKHHISITLHSHGCHAIRAVIAVVIWVMRMGKTWCSPFDAVRHILTWHYQTHWLKLSWGHPQRGVQRRKRQLQSKPTSCLSYWLLQTSIKEGAKQPCSCRAWFSLLFPTEDIEMWSWVWGQLSKYQKSLFSLNLPTLEPFSVHIYMHSE